jgi:hypothetical protein
VTPLRIFVKRFEFTTRADIEIDIPKPFRKVGFEHFRLAKPDYVMKLRPKLSFTVVASLVIAGLMALPLMAQNAVERVARVNALAGVASYSTKGGAFQPLTIGTKLHQGDTIKTTAGSHVDIDLGGNVGIVQVASQSTFVIDKITTTDAGPERLTQTELRVDAGAIYCKINKLAKGSRYEIASPKGIAGIRGTAVYWTADGRLVVLDGVAAVAYPNGAGGVDTFLVHENETVAPDDRPPHAAPMDLLRDIIEALRDAATHGIGHDSPPFVPPLDQLFISPTLPVNAKAPTVDEFPFPDGSGTTIKK